MKKIISALLALSIILLSSISVFAANTSTDEENYNLKEIFVNYKEYSVEEMVKFISTNPTAYYFVNHLSWTGPRFYYFYIRLDSYPHLVPDIESIGITDRPGKYLMSSSRISPSNGALAGDTLLGDNGNKVMHVQVNDDFMNYICSLDRAPKTELILNLLMNMLSHENVVGVSWNYDGNMLYSGGFNINTIEPVIVGDCNGDGEFNGLDGNLMKRTISGMDCTIDPFAVDLNGDGSLNALDSFEMKIKLVG
ncbi:MAG: dockerin type I repeat-containing protein [Clostridia bacterium]|nr:dockerin type I repeat-containing protein [Clostridia bacterium]